jgi:predicted CoA-binding protein
MHKNETVVILGASDKPDRYAYLAFDALKKRGFRVLPVHPTLKEIEGTPVFSSLSEIKESVHTITLYVGPEKSANLSKEILGLSPKRIIFNPGAENKALLQAAQKQGIDAMDACTLVMLTINTF